MNDPIIVKKWHWWTPWTERSFYGDVMSNAVDRVGGGVSAVTDAVVKPFRWLGLSLVALAVIAFVFRKPILKALK